MIILHFGKGFFDFNRLNQAEFLLRYVVLFFLGTWFLSIDTKLIKEVNEGFVIVPFNLITKDGYFFAKWVQVLSFFSFWLCTRRFKDMLNLKEHTSISFFLFAFLYIIFRFYQMDSLLVALLILIPKLTPKKVLAA